MMGNDSIWMKKKEGCWVCMLLMMCALPMRAKEIRKVALVLWRLFFKGRIPNLLIIGGGKFWRRTGQKNSDVEMCGGLSIILQRSFFGGRTAARCARLLLTPARDRRASSTTALFMNTKNNGHVHVGRKVNAWSEEVLGCVVVVVVV